MTECQIDKGDVVLVPLPYSSICLDRGLRWGHGPWDEEEGCRGLVPLRKKPPQGVEDTLYLGTWKLVYSFNRKSVMSFTADWSLKKGLATT